MGRYTYDSTTQQMKKVAGYSGFDQIAPVESSPTTAAHSVGEHFIYGGVIYEVTSAIAIGDTLVIYPLSGYNIKIADDIETQIEGKADAADIPSIVVETVGTASASAVSYQRIEVNGSYYEVSGTKYMEQTQTVSTSIDTPYTFQSADITTDSTIKTFVDTYGINPSNVEVTNGRCVVTIPKQSSEFSLGVRIYIM